MRGSTLLAVLLVSAAAFGADPDGEWPSYGRTPGGERYSPLTAINRQNVSSLQVAWTFRTGDAYQPKQGRPTAFEATPLYVDGTLYVGTPLGRVIALDPVTGKERWSFDGKADRDRGYGDFANRGVSTWKPASGPRRIYIATIDARLIAVDASTGKPTLAFGDNGVVNLRNGLRIPPTGFADYEQTSPPAISGNTIIVGSAIADGAANPPSGEVRGFDAATGKLKWTWHSIPQDPKAPGADTWKDDGAKRTGAANAWSVIAADPQRNLVFVPTGSPSTDYFGGGRVGDNLFANSVVALRADTGQVVWHFQTVHHDLWDYDVAAPPILFDLRRGGRTVRAIAIGSKSGNLFILNRDTGRPIFGVEERPVPQSDALGEVTSPTQPFPVAPPPLAQQRLAEPWGIDGASRQWCVEAIAKLRSEGVFTPPSVRGSLVIPGNIGGMAWGGAAYDRQNHLLIIPVNNLAAEVRLIPRAEFSAQRSANRSDWEFMEQRGADYGVARRFLRSPSGLPCNPPPWGALHAVDTETGALRWTVPVGRFAPTLAPALGSIALGGPIATAGGVAFMAGTLDPAIYAFDTATGKELWRGVLPTSARATPMTYRGPNGKQYVVIAAGGHGIPEAPPLGDFLVAFALP